MTCFGLLARLQKCQASPLGSVAASTVLLKANNMEKVQTSLRSPICEETQATGVKPHSAGHVSEVFQSSA